MTATSELRQPSLRRVQLAARLAGPITGAAVFLSVFPSVRFGDLFFTFSDFLFCFAVILLLTACRIPLRPQGDFTPLWLGGFVTMLGALLVSSIVHGEPFRWLIVAGQYSFAYVLIPLVLMDGDGRRTLALAKVLVASVFAIEFVGIAVYYDYGGPLDFYKRIAPDFITGGGRLGSFLSDANWNGMIVAMTTPLVLYFGFARRVPTFVTAATLTVFAFGLVLASSFTGFSTALVAVALFVLIAGGAGTTLRLCALGAAVFAACWALGMKPPAVFETRVLAAFESGDLARAGTFTGRMNLMKEAWEMVGGIQLIGVGVDRFRQISAGGEPVHNMYLLLWAEGGLLALLGWVVMLAAVLLAAVRVYPLDRRLSALGVSVIVTFIINSIAAPHMYARLWVMPLHLAMGLIFARLAGGAVVPARPRRSVQ